MHEPFLHTSPSIVEAGSAAEDETLPERAPAARETARVGRAEVVVQLLADVRRTLDASRDEKARRMLLRKLESLQFVVDWWGALPPRPEQVSAMLETLLKLQEAAIEARAR
jgi:3-methyladenine DNA glycosylase/8-oxoguanine DNA glycosylase